MNPSKPSFESRNIPSSNISTLASLFPSCITESRGEDGKLKQSVDFDKLRALLSSDIAQGDEAYDFTWVGKKAAIQETGIPIRKTLRPVVKDEVIPTGADSSGKPYCSTGSKNWDTTQNVYIEGDNLDVLKLLQESYLKKVKMIYIDPPYNTGNDFIYNDHFEMDKDEYDEGTGAVDDSGTVNFQQNNDANPRFHSDWCSMIYPRLVLARNLLTDDGVIFISIDDHELKNLENIANEIFGEVNYIGEFPWRKRTAKSDVPFGISQDYEWIVCYAKSNDFYARVEGGSRRYFETPDFPNKPWRIHDLTKQTTASERPNSNFTIVNPRNKTEYPANPLRTWAVTKETFEIYYKEKRIIFPGDYDFLSISRPVLRYWKEDDIKKAGDDFGKISVTTKLPDKIGMSQDGTKEITELLETKVFSFPKPTSLIKYLITICNTDSDSIILDFFSGSATTAHAVMQLNAEDGGNRKFIMVQLPEKCDEESEAYKAGYKTICDIGKERIRRAGDKIIAELKMRNDESKKKNDPQLSLTASNADNSELSSTHSELDIGFRVFKVDDSNMKDVYYSAEETNQQMLSGLESNIKEDRTDMDLLYGCLLDWGLPLSLPHTSETLDGVTVHTVDNGAFIACFDANIPESAIHTIAQRKPLRAVFRDSSFATSPEKINVTEIFKTISPNTGVKVI
jgi:adenine-specific DNA-methyltransferase